MNTRQILRFKKFHRLWGNEIVTLAYIASLNGKLLHPTPQSVSPSQLLTNICLWNFSFTLKVVSILPIFVVAAIAVSDVNDAWGIQPMRRSMKFMYKHLPLKFFIFFESWRSIKFMFKLPVVVISRNVCTFKKRNCDALSFCMTSRTCLIIVESFVIF